MNRIILIGPPGSGKSTVGQALAKHLKCNFVDTDTYIEDRCSKSISDIFVVDGEEKFRSIEFDALTEVVTRDDIVISLGGGAPISDKAQELLRGSDSYIVYLDVSLAIAAPRVGFNRDRPLLLGNPRAQWQALNEARRPIYEKLAQLTVKVDDMKVRDIVNVIESELA